MAERRPTRRRVIQTTGITALAGLAGCTGDVLPGDGSSAEDTPGDGDTTSTTAGPTTVTEEELTPYDEDSLHLHGTMVASINGRTYHFGDKPWNVEERTGVWHFHFHTDGSRDRWHVHSKGVTLAFAFGTMPRLDVSGGSITFRDHTFDATEPGTEFEITANGETVEDPGQYVLEDGDEIEIVVETDAETPTPDEEAETADDTETTEGSETAGEEVTFETAAGSTVDATMYGSGSCGIVLVPQAGSDRSSWEAQATTLAGEEFLVLAVDRGENPSDTVAAAATFLGDEHDVGNVSLVGASVGGEAAVEAAAAAESGAVDGVVTLSASGGAEAVSGFDGRLLVIVARSDEERFVEASNALYDSASDPKRLEIVDGDAHGQDLLSAEQGGRVPGLIEDHLESVCG